MKEISGLIYSPQEDDRSSLEKGFSALRNSSAPRNEPGKPVSVRDEDAEFIRDEYLPRLKIGFDAHEGKMWQIYCAAMTSKQVMTGDVVDLLPISSSAGGNAQDAPENKSVYVHPAGRAIELKIISEMTAAPVEMEFDTLSEDPKVNEAASAINDIIAQQFARQRNVQQLHIATALFANRGTLVAEPFYKRASDTRTWEDKNGKPVPVIGQLPGYLTFSVYDALSTIIDPGATPGRVADTADWCIITLGRWSTERIKKELGVVVNYDKAKNSISMYSIPYVTATETQTPDIYMRALDTASGERPHSGYLVRKYLRASDGMEFFIVDDGFVAKKGLNAQGIIGRLWICWAPYILDIESPYGTPVLSECKPTLDVLSTIFNTVCDIDRINQNMPTFTFSNMVDLADLSQSDSTGTDIKEINVAPYQSEPGFVFDVSKLFYKPRLNALSPETTFIFGEALNALWMLTGLSPQALSGVQETQIRVSSVVDMIQGSSMRNNSMAVRFYESCFLNVLAQEFHFILIQHYDDFPMLSQRGITKEILSSFDSIRVRNGSYLPQDRVSTAQKAAGLLQIANGNRVLDQVKVLRYFAKNALGVNLAQFEQDPLAVISQEQAIAILNLVQQGKLNGFIDMVKQVATQNGGDNNATSGQ